jgi:selenocysteine lyase/cysteine desulfurase
MVGSAAAVDFFASLGTGGNRRARLVSAFSALRARGEVLLARLWNGLESLDGVTLYGPRPGTPRTPTVAFSVAGHPAERVTAHLSDRHGIFTSHGDFYASTVVEDLGLAPHGLVRAGCACYTTEEEVDRLIAGVAELL